MVKETQRLKDLKEIAIVIDTWDDIFSDFDPRPLNERTVSGDFVEELKKRYRETRKGDLTITIYAPLSLKSEESERMVEHRLKEHFQHRYLQHKKIVARLRGQGVVFVLIGVASLTFLTLAAYFQLLTLLTREMLGVVLMPLGWYGFWEGLSKLIDTSPVSLQEEALYSRLAKTAYRFKYI